MEAWPLLRRIGESVYLVPRSRIVESFDLLELTTAEWTALGESQFALIGV
jgi:hypothetical protein